MNAIRPDETLDNLHSIYVDQWDWERVLTPDERDLDLLKTTVRKIYGVIRQAEAVICAGHPALASILPAEITFIHSEDLQERFPDLPPVEREKQVAREHGAVFIIGIGWPLADGSPHDGRAPDYDDWTSANGRGHGLNGDILIWYPLLETAFELSSMGIRVTPEALRLQLAMTGQSQREALYFHQRLLSGELPLSIGGGIGQSRLCMLLLKKAHIGEIQAGIWPADMREALKTRGVILL
jgi:aspartate--ammonia ligase